jgi:hypothetical protein
MRNVLLNVIESPPGATVHSFVTVDGQVFEDDGEELGQSEFDRDWVVQSDMYVREAYVYRPWSPLTIRDRHIAGLLVDLTSTHNQKKPVVSVIDRNDVHPITVGDEAILGGLSLGVVRRIVVRDRFQVVDGTNAALTTEEVRARSGLNHEPYFTQADAMLSKALGKTTNVYKVTADAFKEHMKVN